jgi:exopolyphosphatase/guanosine-5'-triphosphate,3'-diphosphate pyrophosphatase
VPGGLILQTAMAMLGAKEFVVCDRALREGLIVDWMLRNDLIVDRFAFQSSIRQRTVLHQAQRYGVDLARAERVASYALSLYSQTQGLLHTDDGGGRQLLWAAAMLHSCGQHINTGAYHKHSWYLIHHGELLGYSDSEHLMVAAIARYHRRSLPKKRHEAWQLLEDRDQRRLVASMALMLRMAVALDRRPQPVVAGIQVRRDGNSGCSIRLEPMASDLDLSLERWSLAACAPAVEEAVGVRLRVLEPSA